MNINRKTIKEIVKVLEFFYDHEYKRESYKKHDVLGLSRHFTEEELYMMEEGAEFAPKYYEDIIDPQVVAVSQRQGYVVVFGVGYSYTVEAPDMYESPGGSKVHNAFALVDMSGRRPQVEKFIVGDDRHSKKDLLKQHLDSRNFQHFNARALNEDEREDNKQMSYLDSKNYGRTEWEDPEEWEKMRRMDEEWDLRNRNMQQMDEEAHSEANRYEDEFDEAYDQYSKLYEEIEIFEPDEGEYSRWKALGLNALKKEIKKLSERLERLNRERALMNLSSKTY